MTDVVIAHTDLDDSEAAGAELGATIRAGLGALSPDALIVFASPKYDYPALLHSLHGACTPGLLVGCSSAGEFTGDTPKLSSACAVALCSSAMKFHACVGRNLRADRNAAAKSLADCFIGQHSHEYPHRSAMILTDALAGHADDLIEELTLATAGTYQLFGGGAGDDARFARTHVFHGTEAIPDAVVALEILSHAPVGIGVCHGWTPASTPMRVTDSDGMRLISLNAMPAVEAFREHAADTGQTFDEGNPLPFFLHNVLGIRTELGYKLRVPLGINPDGSISCAAELPTGSTAYLMRASVESSAHAATQAAREALQQLKGHKPRVALFFDCVATRLRTGREFGFELGSLKKALGATEFAGCNTYGQIARAEGQFEGFHNCNATIAILPD